MDVETGAAIFWGWVLCALHGAVIYVPACRSTRHVGALFRSVAHDGAGQLT